MCVRGREGRQASKMFCGLATFVDLSARLVWTNLKDRLGFKPKLPHSKFSKHQTLTVSRKLVVPGEEIITAQQSRHERQRMTQTEQTHNSLPLRELTSARFLPSSKGRDP